MSDLRIAAQQALEALEQSETTVRYEGFGMAHREAERKHQAAIAALRTALKGSQQDPELSAALGWVGGISEPLLDRKELLRRVAEGRVAEGRRQGPALAGPVGVPRAWLQEYDPARPALTPRLTLDSGRAAAWAAEGGRVLTLYAEAAPPSAPPRARRLTDETIAELWHKNAGYHHHFARAIERWLNAE